VNIIEFSGATASCIAYVGDRLDNDIMPAWHAGLVAIFIERGPYGQAHVRRAEIAIALRIITTLDALPSMLDGR